MINHNGGKGRILIEKGNIFVVIYDTNIPE
jgi:hypothetical protein